MARPLRGKSLLIVCNRAALAALFILLLLACCCDFIFCAPLQAEEKDDFLEKSGIRYPEGFDLNTVGEIEGKASKFTEADTGPVRFQLISKRDTYTVILSPKWYWSDFGTKISDGEEVRITGSKSLGKDGNLYIIAEELKILSSGQSLVFRSKSGSPLWKGPGSGMRGGYGSPLKGRGGIGAGNGHGRGRR